MTVIRKQSSSSNGIKKATLSQADKRKDSLFLAGCSMKLLLLVLWFPLTTYTMEKALAENAGENVVELLLGKEKTEWHTLPAEFGKVVAQSLLEGHPIVSYILSRISLPNKILKGHTDSVISAVGNERGDLLATRSNDHTIKLWDVQTGMCKKTFQSRGYVDVSCRGNTLLQACSSGNEVWSLYDLGSGNLLHVLKGHKGRIYFVQFGPRGTRVITASVGTAKLWDTVAGKCLQTFVAHKESSDFHEPSVDSFEFSPTGDKIAMCYENMPIEHGRGLTFTVKIWDCSTGVCLHTLPGENKLPVFNRTGDKVVTTSFIERTVKVWDVETGECLHTLPSNLGAQLAARDKIALASEENTVMIWDLEANRCIHSLEGHTDRIAKAVFNEEGDKLVTDQVGRSTKLWDLKTNKCIYTGECSGALKVFGHPLLTDPRMKRMVTVSPTDGLKIWDLTKNACIHTIPSCTDPIIEFDDKANNIVTTPADGTVTVWNSTPLVACQWFLERDISLLQAVVLNAIYEIMIVRALVKKKQLDRRSIGSRLMRSIMHVIGDAEEMIHDESVELVEQELVFDFNKVPHLEEYYEAMPPAIKKVLDPFVRRASKDSESVVN